MSTTVQHVPSPADDLVEGIYGRLAVRYRNLGTTYTVEVEQGTYRIAELCQAYTTAHAAWSEARRVATAAFAGQSVEQIIAAKPSELVMTALREVVGSAQPARLEDAQPTMQVGSATLQPYHPSTQRDVPSLEQAAPDFGHRNTARVATEPTSEAMDVILLAAALNGGRVERSQHANSRQLLALSKRRLVTLDYAWCRNTRTLVAATLNAAGWRHVESLKAVR